VKDPDAGFAARLRNRLAVRGLRLSETEINQLTLYWKLLAKWSRSINLTSFQLDSITDAAVDRLFVEPLLAASFFPDTVRCWYDIGSGGGSPAIPLKVRIPAAPLVMIESRERKTAFLRETARQLNLSDVQVLNARAEDVFQERLHTADVVTLRAVRADQYLVDAINSLLRPSGRLLVFQSSRKVMDLNGLSVEETKSLGPSDDNRLVVYVPRGTNARRSAAYR
jgi:16S rRNA (guanine527-N7)-methyltransferase